MSQFSRHRLRDGDELVSRIQSDPGVETAYLLWAPLVRQDQWGPATPRLHPRVKRGAALGGRVARAVDPLFKGF